MRIKFPNQLAYLFTVFSLILAPLFASAQLQTFSIGGNQIGTVTDNGGGSFTIVGGGNDIWDRQDEFTFHYQEMAGDFEVVTRLESFQQNATHSKAGIMARESLAEDSRMAASLAKPPGPVGGNSQFLAYRTGNFEGDGDGNAHNGGRHEDRDAANPYPNPPYPNAWMKLVRQGATITAYNSTDGVTWNFMASQDTATWSGGALANRLLVGLAVSRHSGGPTAVAEFRNTTITAGAFALGDASSRGISDRIFLAFTQPPGASALDPGNYDIPGVTVSSAAAGSTPNSIVLSTDPLAEGTTYAVNLFGVLGAGGESPAVSTRSFTHGKGYEARKIHVTHNMISGGSVDPFLGSTAYRRLIPVACVTRPAVEPNTVFEDPTPNTGGAGGFENFSTRVFGLIQAPTTGNYRFAISADDNARIFLSTDDNPANIREIAREPVWNNSRDYAGTARRNAAAPENLSAPINLVAGQRYYLEMINCEGGGGNNGSVTWQTPGGAAIVSNQSPIQEVNFATTRFHEGNRGGTLFGNLGPVTIVKQPTDKLNIFEGASVTFSVVADGTPAYKYQWLRNNVAIPGANGAVLTFATASTDHNARYKCQVDNEISSVTSTEALLTVVVDNTAPTVTKVEADGSLNKVFITFSEPVNTADATTPSRYTIAGLSVLSAAINATGNLVTLTTAPQTEGASYVINFGVIRDRSFVGNPLAPGTSAGFRAWVIAPGFALRQFYRGISGTAVADLANSAAYQARTPTDFDYNPLLEGPLNADANYGISISGYLIPQTTASYDFYGSADDGMDFRLNMIADDNNPANLTLVLSEPAWNGSRDYNGTARRNAAAPENRSRTLFPDGILLQAGRKYAFEARMKEGGGGDNISIAAVLNSAPPPPNGSTPISGAFVMAAPANPEGASVTINQQPANLSVVAGVSATFTVAATGATASNPNSALFVQWQRDNGAGFQNIPGANTASYTLPIAALGDSESKFRALVSVPGATVASSAATLIVSDDVEAPQITSTATVDGKHLGVLFNERVRVEDVNDPFNWSVTSGAIELGVGSIQLVDSDGTSVTKVNLVLAEGDTVTSSFTVGVPEVRDIAGNTGTDLTATGGRWMEDIVDINGPLPAGEHFTPNTGEIEIRAGGADVWGASDQFTYLYKRISGNFDVKVRVDHIANVGNPWSKAGLNIRANLDPGAQTLAWIYPTAPTGANQNEMAQRPTAATDFVDIGSPRPAINSFPYWVRVRRVGNQVFGYSGRDGVTWTRNNPATGNPLPDFPFQAYVGIGVVSHIQGTHTTARLAQFSDVILYPDAVVTLTGPDDVNVAENNPAAFQVNASAPGVPASELWYLWEEETSPGVFTPIVGAASSSLIFPVVTAADNNRRFRVTVSAAGSNPAISRTAVLHVGADTEAPFLVSARGNASYKRATVVFNEPVPAGADPFLYEITDSGGGTLAVSFAQFDPSDVTHRTVILDTDLQAENTLYTITAREVEDSAVPPNINPETTTTFRSFVISPGFAKRDIYLNIGGGVLVNDLVTNPKYIARTPDLSDYSSLLEGPLNAYANYGIEISGYFIPRETGNYDFYGSADDGMDFNMNFLADDSNPANLQRVLFEPTWNGSRDYLGTARRTAAAPENRSTTLFPNGIHLEAGHRYAFQALMKEGGGGDNVAVAVVKNGSAPPANGSTPVIGSFYLASPADPTGASVVVTRQPDNAVIGINCASDSNSGSSLPTLGINFASEEPNGAGSAIGLIDVAGVVPQGNWNNLRGASGNAAALTGESGGAPVVTAVSVTWSSPNTWSSTGRGEENNGFPPGGDRALLTGYLDTTADSAGRASVTINGLGSEYTANGYDVIVYCQGGVAGRGGAYTIGSQTLYGTGAASPSAHVQDPGVNQTDRGTYIRFTHLTGASFTLTSDASAPLGNTRAPINGLQIIALPPPPPPPLNIGLNFAADEPSGSSGGVLGAATVAGAVPQANWNNLTGASGSSAGLKADSAGTVQSTGASVTWSCPNTWSATGRGEENIGFATGTGDRTLLTGYLDTDNAGGVATVTVSGLPPEFTSVGYDVLVYVVGGVGGRGGAYTIGGTTLYGTAAANAATHILDPGASLTDTGTYIRFTGMTASSFTLVSDANNANGGNRNFRAPINGIQIVASGGVAPPDPGVANQVTLTVAADGQTAGNDDPPLFVQWEKNGVPIAGANNLTYTTLVSEADNGSQFRARLFVPGASTLSDAATVVVSQAPRVAISSPANGATLVAGTTATIQAVAVDPDGEVVQVVFMAQGIGPIGVDNNGADGWSASVPNIPAGTFILTAVATDNLGVSCTSDPIMVVVVANRPPTCGEHNVVAVEDNNLIIPLASLPIADPDGNPLTLTIVTGPAHGTATASAAFVDYSPAPNYNGPDSITYRVTDSMGASSGVCTININVLPGNDAPTCTAVSATVDEGSSVSITVGYADIDGNPQVGLSITTQPAHGVLSPGGSVNTVIYTPNANYTGPDSFAYSVFDGFVSSSPCTASITVLPGNDPPTVVIEVSPTRDLGSSVTGFTMVSPNNENVCAVLDGSATFDPDGDAIVSYHWFVDGVPVGEGPIIDACLLVGARTVTLEASDGTDTGTGSVSVNVLTGGEALEELVLVVNDSVVERKNKRPFIATLKTAAAAFDRGSVGSALNRLENAFQHKVNAQIGKNNPDVAEEWIRIAQEIIDAYAEPQDCEACQE